MQPEPCPQDVDGALDACENADLPPDDVLRSDGVVVALNGYATRFTVLPPPGDRASSWWRRWKRSGMVLVGRFALQARVRMPR